MVKTVCKEWERQVASAVAAAKYKSEIEILLCTTPDTIWGLELSGPSLFLPAYESLDVVTQRPGMNQ
jgi:hypothetical protein